jgi:TRAP-type C4-dicarboxylate transport system substrate-binding protein
MKRKINQSGLFLVILLWSLLLVSGCSQGVSVEEYDSLSMQFNELQLKATDLQNKNLLQEEQIVQAQAEMMLLQNENSALKQQIADLNENYKLLQDELTDLTNKLTTTTPPTTTPPAPAPAPAPTPTPQQPLTLRFATALSSTSSEYLEIYEPMLDRIEQKSNGKINFDRFPGGTLAAAPDQYEAITNGMIDMGVSYFGYIADRFPLSEAFTFPAAYELTEDGEDLIQALGNRIFAPTPSDTKILCFFQQQPYFLYTASEQVKTSDDLKGLKIGANSSLQTETLTSLGAVPVRMHSTETYIALQRGIIDGALATPSEMDSLNLTEVTNYVLRLPFGYKTGMININEYAWSRIPGDLKPIFEDAAEQAHDNFVEQFNMDDEKVNGMLTGQGGAVYTPSSTKQAQWANVIKPGITQWIADMESEGLPAQDMVNTLRIESQQRGVPFPY